MPFTSEELAAMKRSSARYKSDADSLRNLNAELAERLRTANGSSDSSTLQDLAAANKKIDKLRDQLKQTSRELAARNELRKEARNEARSEPRNEQEETPPPPLTGEERGATNLRNPTAERATAERVRDLEARLSAARQKIQVLEKGKHSDNEPRKTHSGPTEGSLDSPQSDSRFARPNGSINGNSFDARSVDVHYFEEQIADRDKMIATLKHSLEQYGTQQDTTALLAEKALREERIAELEFLLRDTQRVD